MAKTKKETVEKETINVTNIQERDLLTKLKEKAAKEALDKSKAREKQIKIYCKTTTPYLSVPNINNNVAGFIPQGTMLYVEKVIDSYPNGTFYKIREGVYLNTKWDFEIFE
jgi:hypothetical protein